MLRFLRPVLGIILSCAAADAGMENARFALDYKPKWVASKAIPSLCDNPATVTEEPNYSPNYTNTPCDQYSAWCEATGPGQIYLVLGKVSPEGVSAVSFGIAYDGSTGTGIDPAYVTWTPCADGLSFPSNDGVHGDFPQQGGGLRITWNMGDGCPTNGQEVLGSNGLHVVVGVFYVYAYSDAMFKVTPNYNVSGGPEAAISSCGAVTTDLVDVLGLQNVLNYVMGQVGFIRTGFNPCMFDLDASFAGRLCVTRNAPTTWGRMKSMYKEGH